MIKKWKWVCEAGDDGIITVTDYRDNPPINIRSAKLSWTGIEVEE
jgi:hypothetical protein